MERPVVELSIKPAQYPNLRRAESLQPTVDEKVSARRSRRDFAGLGNYRALTHFERVCGHDTLGGRRCGIESVQELRNPGVQVLLSRVMGQGLKDADCQAVLGATEIEHVFAGLSA